MWPLCDAWNALFLGFGPQASVPVGVHAATLRCLGFIIPWVWATGTDACRCVCCHVCSRLELPLKRQPAQSLISSSQCPPQVELQKSTWNFFLPCQLQGRKKFARVFRNFPIGLRQYLPMHVWCVRPVRGVAFTTMLRINPGGTGRVARPSLAAPPLTLLKF